MATTLPRRSSYPLIGAAFAFGAPLGFVAMRAIAQGASPRPSWIAHELAGLWVEYTYLTVSTVLVMAIFGRILGIRDDRLEESASTDALTGLGNRRQLSARLREEVARATRHRTPLAFLLIDVDGLKAINDRGGHDAGDDVLRRVGGAIQDASRADDVPARWGGDEFAVLAPGTSAVDAAELGERICRAIRASKITVSIGVADLDHRHTVDGLGLCRAADRALYLAKERGRDQVAVAHLPNG